MEASWALDLVDRNHWAGYLALQLRLITPSKVVLPVKFLVHRLKKMTAIATMMKKEEATLKAKRSRKDPETSDFKGMIVRRQSEAPLLLFLY